jgi:RNA ligase (TIGR02306 family)
MASIQKIIDIQPIDGADLIQVATINGWKVVVKKDEFKIGDLVTYFEIDSWIPTALAPFLSKGKEPREYISIKGERLRTVRLKGQLSQGLILPLSIVSGGDEIGSFKEDDDVSELVGVVKYDPPVAANLAGVARGNFPIQVPKTDEIRVQNLTKEWDELRTYTYEVTEKIEGQSLSLIMVDGEFHVCSRNLSLKCTEDNPLWGIARRYNVEDNMRTHNLTNFAIQGELYGESVQGNHYSIKGTDFMVYSMYDVTKGEYVSPEARLNICEMLGLKHVPIIANTYTPDNMSIDNILAIANGKSLVNLEKLREGIVFKRINGQEHWKAVSNEYLLKHG